MTGGRREIKHFLHRYQERSVAWTAHQKFGSTRRSTGAYDQKSKTGVETSEMLLFWWEVMILRIGELMICGQTYTVEMVPAGSLEPSKKGMVFVWGRCDLKEQLIEIDEGISQAMIEETLLHEAMHIIAFHTGWKNLEENVIDALANGLYQLGVGADLWLRLRGR